MKSNETDYLRTFILTAQKTGFMPAFALTLHLLSEVDGFLAAATLVSSSERHSVSRTARCGHFSSTVYITSLFHMSVTQQPVRLDTAIPIKGEVPTLHNTLLLPSPFVSE